MISWSIADKLHWVTRIISAFLVLSNISGKFKRLLLGYTLLYFQYLIKSNKTYYESSLNRPTCISYHILCLNQIKSKIFIRTERKENHRPI